MPTEQRGQAGLDRPTPFYKYLTDPVGAGIDLNVDGSVTPVDFRYTAAAGTWVKLVRCNLAMVDGAITPAKFAGLVALTNGLEVMLHDVGDAELFDFMDGQTVKDNTDLIHLAASDSLIVPAAGDDSLPVRWTITKAGDAVYLQPGQYLEVKVSDDLTDITKFRWSVQGQIYTYDPR